MLSTRMLTAALMLPVVIVAILFLPTLGLTALVAALMLIGAWEWASLIRLEGGQRIVFIGLAALLMVLALCFGNLASLVLGLAAVFWLAMIWLVARFPAGWQASLGRFSVALVSGLVVLAGPVLAVASIDQGGRGPLWVLLLCAMIWGADTGAYAVGHLCGRRKLVPRVSPGKTLEGAIGGVAAAMIIGALGALALGLGGWRTLGAAGLGAWIAAISIVGDLTISMFKRSAGVKDSGRLFPGHGGVLDRLDSMLAAAPWFVVGLHGVLLAA